MVRMRLTNVTRLRKEYRADIEIDGRTVGFVEREQDGRGGGLRAGQYKAKSEGLIIATGRTLEELREGLREHFATEYSDARESW